MTLSIAICMNKTQHNGSERWVLCWVSLWWMSLCWMLRNPFKPKYNFMTSQLVKWHHKMPNDVTKCQMTSQNVKWHHKMSSAITKCQMTSQNVKWCHKMSSDVTKCRMMTQVVKWHHKMSSDVTKCQVISQMSNVVTWTTFFVFNWKVSKWNILNNWSKLLLITKTLSFAFNAPTIS